MFFRNLSLFRFSPVVGADLSRLGEALADHRLRAVGPMELATRGFVPPIGGQESAPLVRTTGHCTLFTIGGQDKLLPAAVVNDELQRKVQQIAHDQGRRVGGRERKLLRDDLLTELLLRAFARSSRLSRYADMENGWLVRDTASRKAAENAVTQIRQALGSFPAVPPAPERGTRILLTDWLANGTLPAKLALGDECELRDPATPAGSRWKGRNVDLDSDEVKEHLRSGKQVFALGLVFDERISFVLGEDLVIRKLKFLDVVVDELADSTYDATAEPDASFALMTLELERLLHKLAEWFGIPRPQGGVA